MYVCARAFALELAKLIGYLKRVNYVCILLKNVSIHFILGTHTQRVTVRLFASTCILTLHSLHMWISPIYTVFPDDFTTTPNPPQFTFNAGTMEGVSQCIPVAVVGDPDPEPLEEEALVRIQADPSFIVNGGGGGLSDFVIITVVDNDSGK